MGQLILPESGAVYPDADCVIYSVERIEPYRRILEPVWRRGGIITSDLTLLEVLGSGLINPTYNDRSDTNGGEESMSAAVITGSDPTPVFKFGE